MSLSRKAAKRALEGVGLGFVVEARRALLARRTGAAADEGIDRASIARRHLRGAGLEIGALHAPVPVPDDVVVRFVDNFSQHDNAARFPDLARAEIIEPDYLEDGFELSSIPSDSQDFVIASHVLEHSSNPIQVLENWSRVTRPGGALYVIVPIAESCFDAGREETALEHLIEDHALYARGEDERIRERNRSHYQEWIAISERRIFEDQGHAFDLPSDEAIAMRVQQLLDASVEIHFHTFSPESFRSLLDHFCEVRRPGSRVVECRASSHEVVGVVKLGKRVG
jgi:SAM-dependent methyltransferase